jgi:hypothetical protein
MCISFATLETNQNCEEQAILMLLIPRKCNFVAYMHVDFCIPQSAVRLSNGDVL